MSRSINLIPQEEVQQQVEKKVLSLSTILTIILLVIAGGISAYYIVTTNELKTKIQEADSSISGLRSNIQALSDIEISARNLDKKYKVLDLIFKSRVHYSLLMEELNTRRPESVSLTDFNVREATKLNVSGKADTYISVADFTNKLLDKEFDEGNPNLKEVFTNVTLNAVNLESKSGGVNFSITIEFKPEVLK